MNIQKIITQAPVYFALFFLIALPFNIRKIFNFNEIKNIEGFRENLSWSIFPFDIALLLLLLSLILLLFSEKQRFRTKSVFSYLFKNPFFLFILWLLFSIFLATDSSVALYGTIRLFLSILAFYLLLKVLSHRRRVFIYAVYTLLISGFLQAILGIAQFIFQKSMGLKILGESEIGSSILGVAKFEIAGTKIIRAYGTFPHPNLFAAFLLFTFAAGIWIVLSTNFSKKAKLQNIFLPTSLAIIMAGIVLSYSRSVIIVLGVFLAILLFIHRDYFVKLFKQICKHLRIPNLLQGSFGILLAFSLLFVSYNLLSPRICLTNCEGDNSIDLRFEYIKTASSIISAKPFLGIGMGNFVLFQENKKMHNLQIWEQQPVHNIYLLIASELGLFGLVFFLSLIIYLSQTFQQDFFKRLQNPFVLCFFAFLILGVADHYFWTLPQGMLIFWVSLAFFHSSANITKVEK